MDTCCNKTLAAEAGLLFEIRGGLKKQTAVGEMLLELYHF